MEEGIENNFKHFNQFNQQHDNKKGAGNLMFPVHGK